VSAGDRTVRRGSLRFVRRPYPGDADGERLLVVGDHWESGAEVVLHVHDPADHDYLAPGPFDEREHGAEETFVGSFDGRLYDPDAKDPPNRVGFTTSPASFDHGCTVELEVFRCAVFPGELERDYRRVLVRGGTGFSVGQVMRYHDFADEDPRAVRDGYAARRAAEEARRAEEARAAADDGVFLASLTLRELEAEHERRGGVELWTREAELRRERSKLALPLRRQAELDAAWAALRARVPCGATILVPARPRVPRTDPWSIRQFGTHEPGTPAWLVHVVAPLWSPEDRPIRDREYQVMLDEDQGYSCRSALELAEWAAKGYVTDAYPSVELRRKFYQRVGSGIVDAPRAVVGGKTYYVGSPRYGGAALVLDGETMNLCRSKRVARLVEEAHAWHSAHRRAAEAIAHRESLPEGHASRVDLPAMRAGLAAREATRVRYAAVDYAVPDVPCLTVAEALAARGEGES